jgi:hypothetical protein
MSSIVIREIKPAGVNLFIDSESYLNELSEAELEITGGATPAWVAASSRPCAAGAAIVAEKVVDKLVDWLFD